MYGKERLLLYTLLVLAAGTLLAPLEAAICARSRDSWHLHADETTWHVFAPREGNGPARWWLSTPVRRDRSRPSSNAADSPWAPFYSLITILITSAGPASWQAGATSP